MKLQRIRNLEYQLHWLEIDRRNGRISNEDANEYRKEIMTLIRYLSN